MEGASQQIQTESELRPVGKMRLYRLTKPELRDLEAELKSIGIPRAFWGQVTYICGKHLQAAIDRRAPLWRRVWTWIKGAA